jgi:hypothetical protein
MSATTPALVGARSDLLAGRFPWQAMKTMETKVRSLEPGPSADLGWRLADHQSRLRLKREDDQTIVEAFPLSSSNLCWRLSIPTKALLPSRTIARSGQYFLLAEGQSRMHILESDDGRLMATWFLPNGFADPGRSAVYDARTLATARPGQRVLDLWTDLGRIQHSIPLPSPALWLVSPEPGLLLIGHEDGLVRLWPEGTTVRWPAPVETPVLLDRSNLWIGDQAFGRTR